MMDEAKSTLMKLEYIEPEPLVWEHNVVNASLDEVGLDRCLKWRKALVGYVFGSDPELDSVENFIALNWTKYGSVKLLCVQAQQVLDEGPWFLDHRPFILKRHDLFEPLTKESVRSVPVWIKLPGLSLQLRNTRCLSKIASVIGNPLFVEKSCMEGQTLTDPRICVEINADCDESPEYVKVNLPDLRWIPGLQSRESVQVKVEYEWLPPLCKVCREFGHVDDGPGLWRNRASKGQRLTNPRIYVEINADTEIPEYVKFKHGFFDQANRVKLEFIEPARDHKGQKLAKASQSEVLSESKKWENALVGYVFGDAPELAYVEDFIALNWKQYGKEKLHWLEDQPGVFVFVSESFDYGKQILGRGPWFLVWIKLPGLSLRLCTPRLLSAIASVVGKPLFAEEVGIDGQRLAVPRICVEIDAGSETTEYVKLEKVIDSMHDCAKIKMEYEWLPPFCKVCIFFGHVAEEHHIYASQAQSYVRRIDSDEL
ncbi:hypothetical protein Tsubulata_003685 [Turnera subulata]|uniref:DUF4283 domain-containing protein n=1 Tax=Turnera subulata TaxID=218843 RepID=A0A9Q0GEQ4_9ROSI|nr:hypothetical protein Tsubulata_003685 [Turnera subulata]